jgi:xanthine/uracil permease
VQPLRQGRGLGRLLSLSRILALRVWILLVILPFVVSGIVLMLLGVSLIYGSVDRVYGFVQFSPLLVIGAVLLCMGLLIRIILRRSDADQSDRGD